MTTVFNSQCLIYSRDKKIAYYNCANFECLILLKMLIISIGLVCVYIILRFIWKIKISNETFANFECFNYNKKQNSTLFMLNFSFYIELKHKIILWQS